MIPTHFRFKNKKDAKYWDTNTKMWHQISEIQVELHGYEISSTQFAWVYVRFGDKDIEFKYAPDEVSDDN